MQLGIAVAAERGPEPWEQVPSRAAGHVDEVAEAKAQLVRRVEACQLNVHRVRGSALFTPRSRRKAVASAQSGMCVDELNLVSFGLVGLIINTGMVLIAAAIGDNLRLGFSLAGWPPGPIDLDVIVAAFLVSIILSVVSTLIALVRLAAPRL